MPASGSFRAPGRVPAAGRDIDTLYGNFTIRPHRSMSDHGMFRLLLVVGVTGGLFDLALFLHFGWIVGVITLVDIVFVGIALAVSQRERHANETVVVFGDGVQVERRSASGRLLFSHWLPLFPIAVRYSNDRSGAGHVELVSGGREVRIAAALLPNERESFCTALLDSLERAGAVIGTRPLPSLARPGGFDTPIQDYK